jgi:nicotinate-nucleotide adenylyltransferase
MRLAIFGGTFDPIHKAHLRVATEAADALDLERVLFVTAGNPPHKLAGATTDFEHRHRMVELACAADGRFVPSRLESGAGKSYSIDTIGKVRSMLPDGSHLFFLIGADAFADIATWHRSSEVIENVEFIVVSRPGYEYPVPEGARIHRLESVALDVSSSAIRKRCVQGKWDALAEVLPGSVLEYVKLHHLYQNA